MVAQAPLAHQHLVMLGCRTQLLGELGHLRLILGTIKAREAPLVEVEVHMRVNDDVLVLVLRQQVVPGSKLELVVEHQRHLWAHNGAQALVHAVVEVQERLAGDDLRFGHALREAFAVVL